MALRADKPVEPNCMSRGCMPAIGRILERFEARCYPAAQKPGRLCPLKSASHCLRGGLLPGGALHLEIAKRLDYTGAAFPTGDIAIGGTDGCFHRVHGIARACDPSR